MTIINGLSFEAGPVVLVFGGVALLLSVGLWMLWSWAWVGTMCCKSWPLSSLFTIGLQAV